MAENLHAEAEARVEPSCPFSSSSGRPFLQSTQKRPVERKPVTPAALVSREGLLSCFLCLLQSGYHSAEVIFFFSFYLFRNAPYPKNLNSRWETKACPFQAESQTGMWPRPAWPRKPSSGSEVSAGKTQRASLEQIPPGHSRKAELGGGEGTAECCYCVPDSDSCHSPPISPRSCLGVTSEQIGLEFS